MVAHGFFAEEQSASDFEVGLSLGDEFENLMLAFRELGKGCGRRAQGRCEVRDQAVSDRLAVERVAGGNGADGTIDVGGRRRFQ